MTLQQLLYFKEISNTLHFTEAAQNLHITQSALSCAIAVLERELGEALFVRERGKRVRLTSFGKSLLPMVNRCIEDFNLLEDTARQLRNTLSGEVSVAYSFINGGSFVPRIFSSFHALEPFRDIKINFNINYKRVHYEEACARGEVDLVFSSMTNPENLESVLFARQQLYAAMPVNHPLSGEQSLTIEDISVEPLIGYNEHDFLDNWRRDIFRAHSIHPNFLFFCEDWLDQLSQVALGNGIAITSRTNITPELIRLVPIADERSQRAIYLMWAKNRRLSPAAEYVRDCCLSFYEEPPVV